MSSAEDLPKNSKSKELNDLHVSILIDYVKYEAHILKEGFNDIAVRVDKIVKLGGHSQDNWLIC